MTLMTIPTYLLQQTPPIYSIPCLPMTSLSLHICTHQGTMPLSQYLYHYHEVPICTLLPPCHTAECRRPMRKKIVTQTNHQFYIMTISSIPSFINMLTLAPHHQGHLSLDPQKTHTSRPARTISSALSSRPFLPVQYHRTAQRKQLLCYPSLPTA